jgi:C-terminal processing protease CtpA/Prc
MKKLLIPVLFFATAHSQQIIAQEREQEKIIIQENGDAKKIVIEIKDGDLYIDNKKITKDINKKNLIIIKEFKNAITDPSTDLELKIDGPLELNWDMEASSNKAVLGVMTEMTDNQSGALVKEVVPGSAADNAGIVSGDIITKIGDKAITGPQDLVNAISAYQGGDEVSIEILHQNKSQDHKVVLQSKPNTPGLINGDHFLGGLEEMFKSFKGFNSDNFLLKSFGWDNINSAEVPKIGVQVEDRADGVGVRVLNITQGEPMDQAGIKIDDVITEFNGMNINSVEDLTRALVSSNGKSEVKFIAKRNGKDLDFKLKMPIKLKKKDF